MTEATGGSSAGHIAVLGGGAWGTALAQTAALAGNDVRLWARESDVVSSINDRHENTVFLAGAALSPRIQATMDAAVAIDGAAAVLVVTPAQFMRPVLKDLVDHWRDGLPAVLCCKGLELSSLKRMDEVLVETIPQARRAVLSGPTFAIEVAKGLPTAVTLAADDRQLAESLSQLLGHAAFRPYISEDMVGVEIGGAFKNVYAIGCGIVLGKGLGENAKAAFMTRGLAEMLRLGQAVGATPESMMGMSGMGDLVLTCSSMQSRNCSLGFAIGEGQKASDILAARNTVAEGVPTAAAMADLVRNLGLDCPVALAVDAIVNHDADIESTIAALLSRPFKAEISVESKA